MNTAFFRHLLPGKAHPKHVLEKSILFRKASSFGQLAMVFKSAEEHMFNVCLGDHFFAVASRDIGRPKSNMLLPVFHYRSQIHNQMAPLLAADFFRPPDFHKVSRQRMIVTREVLLALEFGK